MARTSCPTDTLYEMWLTYKIVPRKWRGHLVRQRRCMERDFAQSDSCSNSNMPPNHGSLVRAICRSECELHCTGLWRDLRGADNLIWFVYELKRNEKDPCIKRKIKEEQYIGSMKEREAKRNGSRSWWKTKYQSKNHIAKSKTHHLTRSRVACPEICQRVGRRLWQAG